MKASLKAAWPGRLQYAQIISEQTNSVVLVMLARNVPCMNGDKHTMMPIQGNVIVHSTWERWRSNGATFKALAAFFHGERIPVPAHLKRGY